MLIMIGVIFIPLAILRKFWTGLHTSKTYKNKGGYWKYKNSGRYVHIVNAEKKVGDKIFSGYEVHHKDKNINNNHISNLAVLKKLFHQDVVHNKKK